MVKPTFNVGSGPETTLPLRVANVSLKNFLPRLFNMKSHKMP